MSQHRKCLLSSFRRKERKTKGGGGGGRHSLEVCSIVHSVKDAHLVYLLNISKLLGEMAEKCVCLTAINDECDLCLADGSPLTSSTRQVRSIVLGGKI